MSIFTEKRVGKITGHFIVEVTRKKVKTRRKVATYAEALEIEKAMKRGLYVPKDTEKKGTTYPLSVWAKEARVVWCGRKDEKQSSRRLEVAVGVLGPDVAVGDLDTDRLDKLVTHFRKQKLDPKTINRYLASVSAALRWARKRKRIDVMPDIPWLKESKGRIVFLSAEDEFKLVANLEGDHALITTLLIRTGMRVGELSALTHNHVTDEWIHIQDSKSGYERYVPIPEGLGASLRALLLRGLPDYRGYLKALVRASNAAQLPIHVTPHVLRHTTATRLIARGASLPVTKELLGHRSVNTTMGYVHIQQEDLKRAAKLLGTS